MQYIEIVKSTTVCYGIEDLRACIGTITIQLSFIIQWLDQLTATLCKKTNENQFMNKWINTYVLVLLFQVRFISRSRTGTFKDDMILMTVFPLQISNIGNFPQIATFLLYHQISIFILEIIYLDRKDDEELSVGMGCMGPIYEMAELRSCDR